MSYAIVNRAKEIIFSMEGKYTSVTPDDNGALSVGACQWHGNRAKALLRTIVTGLIKAGLVPLKEPEIVKEICSSKSWAKRTLTTFEKDYIKVLLSFKESFTAQDKLADKDIQGYINHIVSLGICEEETIILLADIENQGGAGAVNRIVKQAIKEYGQDATLEDVLKTAINDKVFKKYAQRRYDVYKRLTGRAYIDSGYIKYVVEQGDNLTEIAERFDSTYKKIAKDNGIEAPYVIYPNQVLRIYQ